MATVIEEDDWGLYTVIRPPRGSNGDSWRPYELNFGEIMCALNVNARSYPSLSSVANYSVNKYSINKPRQPYISPSLENPYDAMGLTKSYITISGVSVSQWEQNYHYNGYWTTQSISGLGTSWTAPSHSGNYAFYDMYGCVARVKISSYMYVQPGTGGFQSKPFSLGALTMSPASGNSAGNYVSATFSISGFFVWDNYSAENFTGYTPDVWEGSTSSYSHPSGTPDLNRGIFYSEAGFMGLQYAYGTRNTTSAIPIVLVLYTTSKRSLACISYVTKISSNTHYSIDKYPNSSVYLPLFTGYTYSQSTASALESRFANDETIYATLAAVFDAGNNSSLLVSLECGTTSLGSAGVTTYPLVYFTSATVKIGCYHGSYSTSTDHALYFFINEISADYFNPSGYDADLSFRINPYGDGTSPINVEYLSQNVTSSRTITQDSWVNLGWTTTPSTTIPRMIVVWTSSSRVPSTYKVRFSIFGPYNTDMYTKVSNGTMLADVMEFTVPSYGNTTYLSSDMYY